MVHRRALVNFSSLLELSLSMDLRNPLQPKVTQDIVKRLSFVCFLRLNLRRCRFRGSLVCVLLALCGRSQPSFACSLSYGLGRVLRPVLIVVGRPLFLARYSSFQISLSSCCRHVSKVVCGHGLLRSHLARAGPFAG